MIFENEAGRRVRVTDNSHDARCYEVGWEGVLLGCGQVLGEPATPGVTSRVGVRFDPGLQPERPQLGNGDLGDDGGDITTGFRWHVPKFCLELAGPQDYTKYDEGGVV